MLVLAIVPFPHQLKGGAENFSLDQILFKLIPSNLQFLFLSSPHNTLLIMDGRHKNYYDRS